MTRAALALLAASALAAAGCTSSSTTTTGPQLGQPSAIAIFDGLSLHDPANLVPYLAIANAARNDLTLVDVRTDTLVEAPVRLRPLAIPFPARPTLLVSADLGDGLADLLVGVSAGDATLQLVRTWAPDNIIVDNPPGSDADGDQSVTLAGEDILALAALPSPAGTARLAVSLAGGRLAVVHYRRKAAGVAIEKDTSVLPQAFEVHDLGFQPSALATVPGRPHLYAATLDPIGPGSVRGVAEIDVSGAGPWPVRALDARGPTRLVAGARLLERRRDAVEASEAAFAGQVPVARVYAVLDESGCGSRRRIDCGLVALDPDKVPAAGDDHIPDDDWSQADGSSLMPYRAPIRFEVSRPLVLAVAAPPASPPADAAYPAGFMRIQLDAESPVITTAVGVLALESGALQFVDLGRFRIASPSSLPVSAAVNAKPPAFLDTGPEGSPDETRIWLKDPGTNLFAGTDTGALAVGITPGYTPDASWTVSYQGILPGLEARAAEAAVDAPGADPWLAIQVGEGPRGAHVTSQVAKLYHPALGVAAGDIAVIRRTDTAGNVICTLTTPPDATATTEEFEVPIAGLLAPTVDHPGGALQLGPPSPTDPPAAPGEWATCYESLKGMADAAFGASAVVPRLVATIRAGGGAGGGRLLLVRNHTQYAGRPQSPVSPPDPTMYDFALQYPGGAGADEDALAALCPLADWDGVFLPAAPPPACDTPTCRADCEKLVLARLARRLHHLADSCDPGTGTPDAACVARYPATFSFQNGPALKFRVGIETGTIGLAAPHRGHSFTFDTKSGAQALADIPDGTTVQANAALAFDASTAAQPAETYRFFVSYPGNQVVVVSPTASPVARNTFR